MYFSQIFSRIFQIFINFTGYFWKISPNFRALPKSTIFPISERLILPNILSTPLNRKILHKLLRYVISFVTLQDTKTNVICNLPSEKLILLVLLFSTSRHVGSSLEFEGNPNKNSRKAHSKRQNFCMFNFSVL